LLYNVKKFHIISQKRFIMIFVIAVSVLEADCREKFIAAVKENIPLVRAENGCISYSLACDCESGLSAQIFDGENSVTFVECWESVEHLKAHLQAPHMNVFREKVKGMRKSSSLKVLKVLA